MMTLEEVWENLKQDTEIKATMEEVDKSYKLFKKIENLIIADLEAKLAETVEIINGCSMQLNIEKSKEIQQLKQQLAEKEKYTYTGKEVGEIERNYESQIAEKDQAIESLQEINQSLGQTCNNDAKEIERLREQLAELKQDYDNLFDSYVEAKKQLNEKEREETKRMQDFEKGCQEYYSSDKYKKDFAIAELQKVLKTMEEKQFYKKEDTAYCVHPAQIAEYVLKQIKSLKGKK